MVTVTTIDLCVIKILLSAVKYIWNLYIYGTYVCQLHQIAAMKRDLS